MQLDACNSIILQYFNTIFDSISDTRLILIGLAMSHLQRYIKKSGADPGFDQGGPRS